MAKQNMIPSLKKACIALGLAESSDFTSNNLVYTLKELAVATGAAESVDDISSNNATGVLEYIADNPPLEIVPWSTGTDEQIAKMVKALDDGKITIADTGWQIGDEREVSLAAMEATGVGESHAAQSVAMVLMDSQHYDLVTATAGGSTKDHFVVGLKNCLNEPGYMNSTDTNVGSWNACARRAWCNDVFKAAIPQTLRNCFKQFQVITATAVDSIVNQTTNDYFALFAEKEVFGEYTWSNETEAAALTQIEYYETAANRIKTIDGSAGGWQERSPAASKGETDSFGEVSIDGRGQSCPADSPSGLSPFGCI